jgi:hypothetical protein
LVAHFALFELKDDCRPEAERTEAGRYREPTFLGLMAGGCLSADKLRQASPGFCLCRPAPIRAGRKSARRLTVVRLFRGG